MMADPIFNPATGAGQAANPPVQSTDTHQDIFGGSNDIFNNPDMFQPVAPETAPTHEDFNLDLGQLQANEYAPAPAEPQIIEPQLETHETWNEYQAKQNPPQPEIIEQIIEPEMKPEVKVNPRRQGTPQQMTGQATNSEQLTVPKPQQAKPQVQVAPQPKPQIQQPKPQVQTPRPQPVQVVRPPEIKAEAKPAAPVVQAPERKETAPQNTTSDLQKKFIELMNTARNVYTLEKKDTDQALELLGANNDKVTILYQITLPENGISIKKIETDTSTQEEMINDLGFVLDTDTNSLQVIIDDVLLFDEVEHLQDDPKKKMQVTEKINKFIFLLSEHQKKIEKEAKEKEEAEQDRRRLQDIFRNF